MSKELDTKKKKSSGSKSTGAKTSGKKATSKRAKKRKKAKMITFAIEAVILVALLVVLYVLNRTERFSKVVYDDKVVEESVNELAEEIITNYKEYGVIYLKNAIAIFLQRNQDTAIMNMVLLQT